MTKAQEEAAAQAGSFLGPLLDAMAGVLQADSRHIAAYRAMSYKAKSWRAKADEVCGRLPDDVQ